MARIEGSYGVDAPWVPWMLTAIGVVYVVLAVCAGVLWDSPATAVVVGIIGLACLGSAALFWHATLHGKFALWQRLLDELPVLPRRALDMGCGRGAVAIMVATCFPSVLVDGIDLWRSQDQSGNDPDATRANIAANELSDRIVLATGDMRALPYPDAVFDLVTASLSIHNIKPASERAQAVDEAWRVLRPGGRLLIVDIAKVPEYERRLHEAGGIDVECTAVGWRMWWGGPWMTTSVLHAVKPAG